MAQAWIPLDHSAWNETKWSAEGLMAREASKQVVATMLDRTKEIGTGGRDLNVEEIVNLDASPVGDDGEVVDVKPPATNVTLSVDQYWHVSIKPRNDYDLQVKLKARPTWSPKMGEALAREMEERALALETGVAAANIITITGDLSDSDLLALKVILDNANVPSTGRFLYVSSNQQGVILGLQRHSDKDFIGPGQMPAVTGQMGKLIYGARPMWSTLTRRRTIGAEAYTINMMYQKEAWSKAVQQDVKSDLEKRSLATRIIMSHLYGLLAERLDHIAVARTTGL